MTLVFVSFCLDGDLLALSYRSASFLRGSSAPLSTQLHLHGNQSLLQKWNTIREGEKSLISPPPLRFMLITHRSNLRRAEKRRYSAHTVCCCCCEGGWTDGWTRWHRSDVLMCNSWKHFICEASFCLWALKMRINSRFTEPSCLILTSFVF